MTERNHCMQVAGPPMHIGPGEPSWTAAVAPMPKPWPVREAAAIAMRWNLARGDDHLLSSQSDPHLREESKQVMDAHFAEEFERISCPMTMLAACWCLCAEAIFCNLAFLWQLQDSDLSTSEAACQKS